MEIPQKSALLTEQAAAWLVALDSGTADLQAFEVWRSADPRHATAFAEVAATWGRLDALRPIRGASEDRRAPSRRFLLQAAGVGGIALIGGSIALVNRVGTRSSAETAIGERRSFLLEDGTRLELNTNTKVEWRIGRRERAVWLDRGEIALDIAAAAMPLLLHAFAEQTQLVPGRYNARLTGKALELLVVAGQAMMQDRSNMPKAPAGSRALLGAGPPTVRPAEPVALERAQAWRRGELVFNGESLEFVVNEFNRYLNRRIVIADAELAKHRLGGRFTSNDPGEFLTALQATFGIRVVDDGVTSLVLRAGR